MPHDTDALQWEDLGLIPYALALALQERLRDRRLASEIPDRLLLLEHPAVITLGRKECDDDIVSSRETLAGFGIEVVKTNRGGRATYHGPGQLVGYYICDLAGLGVGVREFVTAVEEVLIRTLAAYGIEGARDAEHPGIWIGRDKIAAIGLSVTHGVTMHGFALNVTNDLSAFDHIVACGIRGRGVTSLTRLLARETPMEDVKRRVVLHTGDVLKRPMVEVREGKTVL